jgi:peroxiredoxin
VTAVFAVGWLSEFARENVNFTGVLFSKDDTPGCTIEACSFRDANREMQQRGIVVLGISKDSLSSHKQFADKYQLPYPLLADTDATVAQEYGAYGEKNMYGKICMVRSIWALTALPFL